MRAAVGDSVHLCGEMAEWFKAHAWKACVGNTTVSSNLTLSASFFQAGSCGGGKTSGTLACFFPKPFQIYPMRIYLILTTVIVFISGLTAESFARESQLLGADWHFKPGD